MPRDHRGGDANAAHKKHAYGHSANPLADEDAVLADLDGLQFDDYGDKDAHGKKNKKGASGHRQHAVQNSMYDPDSSDEDHDYHHGDKHGKKGKKGHRQGPTQAQTLQRRLRALTTEERQKDAFKGKGAYVRTKRSCTDCMPCIVMLVYWAGMLLLAEYAFSHGDLDHLILPKDSDGYTCGTRNTSPHMKKAGLAGPDLTGAARQYFPTPADHKLSICVPYCPGNYPGRCIGNKSRDYYGNILSTSLEIVQQAEASALSKAKKGLAKASASQLVQQALNRTGNNASSKVNSSLAKVNNQAQGLFELAAESICTSEMPGPHGFCKEATCSMHGDCQNTCGGLSKVRTKKIECITFGDCREKLETWNSNRTAKVNATQVKHNVRHATCVNGTWTADIWKPYSWEANRIKPFICKDKHSPSAPQHPSYPPKDLETALEFDFVGAAGPCWMPVLESSELLFRCIPHLLVDFKNPDAFKKSIAGQASAKYFNDLKEYWRVIPIVMVGAMLASFVWVFFLSYVAGLLIWTTIWAVEVLLPFFSLFFLYRSGFFDALIHKKEVVILNVTGTYNTTAEFLAAKAKVEEGAAHLTEVLHQFGHLSADQNYIAGVVCFVAFCIIAIVFCTFKSRISLSIAVIEEASDAFLSMKLCIFSPVATLIFSIPVLVYTALTTALIVSLRTIDGTSGEYEYSNEVKGMLAYNVFGGIWTLWWLTVTQYTTIAGAVASWYFSLEKKEFGGTLALLSSFTRVARYHMGTMAFGSFLIAAVIWAKYILLYLIQQVQAQSPENKLVKILAGVLKCLVACVEKFVKFLGCLAFIQTSIYGSSFCPSLWKAFKRLLKNVVRFSFVTLFSKFALLLGKVGVVLFGAWLSVTIIAAQPRSVIDEIVAGDYPIPTEYDLINASDLRHLRHPPMQVHKGGLPHVPIGVAAVVSGIIAFSILGIYETAIDTILVCFLEDEIGNGEKGRHTFASKHLRKFMAGTKSLAEAAERYENTVRDAKTNKVRQTNASEKRLTKVQKGKRKVARERVKRHKEARKHDKKHEKRRGKKTQEDSDLDK